MVHELFDLSRATPYEVITAANDKVVVRLVQQDEEDRVREISHGVFKYDGLPCMDYVPTYFKRWIHSSNHLLLGLEVNGVLEGFNCRTIIDDGKTLWKEGMRINPTQRGKKLFRYFSDGCDHYEKVVLSPRIRKVRYAKSFSSPDQIQQELKIRPNVPIIDLRKSFTFVIDENFSSNAAHLTAYWTNKNQNSRKTVTRISTDEAFDLLTKNPHLLSNNVITTDWISYELSKRNLLLLETGGLGGWERMFYSISNGGILSSFAVVSFTPATGGFFKGLEIFSNDLEDVLHFIAHHLENTTKTNPSNVKPCLMLIWLSETVHRMPELQQFVAPLKSSLTKFRVIFSSDTNVPIYASL